MEAARVDADDHQQMEQASFGRSASDLWLSLKLVVTNLSFVFLTLGATIESGAVMGFATFMPKILQFQFSLTPAGAAILAGALAVSNNSSCVKSNRPQHNLRLCTLLLYNVSFV